MGQQTMRHELGFHVKQAPHTGYILCDVLGVSIYKKSASATRLI
jgi:hypothetical protein